MLLGNSVLGEKEKKKKKVKREKKKVWLSPDKFLKPNHYYRMASVGRGLKNHPVPTPLEIKEILRDENFSAAIKITSFTSVMSHCAVNIK